MAKRVIGMDVRMLVATLPADANLSEWCRRLGVSRDRAYYWRRRFAESGAAGLEDRSRAPKRPAGRTPAVVEDAVVAVRKQLAEEGFDCGPVSVHDRMTDQGLVAPSEATIYRILVRRGQITPQPKKRPRVSWRRFERERPNECWQGDDTHYDLANGQEVRIINLLDDHSRVNVDSLAVINLRTVRVWESFCRAMDRYGCPAEFLNDNGRAYHSPTDQQPVLFQRELRDLGVRHLRSSPHHPQTCGKIERFHQTQRQWLNARPPAATVADLQRLLDEFREAYNTTRRHRGIGRRFPIDTWRAQPPATPTGAQPTKPRISDHRVTATGTVHFGQRFALGIGRAWAGQPVRLIRRDHHVTVIHAETGEILRELDIDPTRLSQPRTPPAPKV
jgi:transposase InsO family protein